MNHYIFEIKTEKGRRIVHMNSKHLNGAVRKLYQEETEPFEIKKILKG